MKRRKWKLLSVMILFLVSVFFVRHFHLVNLNPENLKQWILSYGMWGPVFYIFLYAIRPLFFIPATLLTLVGGLAFGPWWGTVYVLIGASLGAYALFAMARLLGREAVERLFGSKLEKWEQQIETYGFRTILFMRLIPLFPFDAVSIGAGLTHVRFRNFALATTLGMIPGVLAYNFLGSSLDHLFSPPFFIALGLVVMLSIIPVIFKWVSRKKRKETEHE